MNGYTVLIRLKSAPTGRHSSIYTVLVWRLRSFPQTSNRRDGAANLEEDVEVYEGNPQSRCDTPESYAVFVLQAVSDETFKKSTVPILQLVN